MDYNVACLRRGARDNMPSSNHPTSLFDIYLRFLTSCASHVTFPTSIDSIHLSSLFTPCKLPTGLTTAHNLVLFGDPGQRAIPNLFMAARSERQINYHATMSEPAHVRLKCIHLAVLPFLLGPCRQKQVNSVLLCLSTGLYEIGLCLCLHEFVD